MLLGATDQGSSEKVVQSLLALSEGNHNVTNAQNHPGEPFREMSARGAFELNPVAIEVGDFHSKDQLANSRLIGRALHESFVQPRAKKQQDESKATAEET